MKLPRIAFASLLAIGAAQAAEPVLMSADWGPAACDAWNADPVLTDKLVESGWVKNDAKRGFKEKVVDGGLRMVETPDLLFGMGRSGWDPWDTLNRMDYIRRGEWDIVHGFDSRPAVVLRNISTSRQRTA